MRRLGGTVTIRPGRDRVDGSSYFTVRHVSRGGDIAFESGPIPDEDRAIQAPLMRLPRPSSSNASEVETTTIEEIRQIGEAVTAAADLVQCADCWCAISPTGVTQRRLKRWRKREVRYKRRHRPGVPDSVRRWR
ncbi:hypothetical protein [Bradyrhizobium erythrophlei]|uniref:hypothetical protein n=1 Tax=Bradyrhizobium erythrophlei TaxID=1437360 RepID=UPI000B843F14|nr:hypothetical protein [Bradyrhizobium erythrophlei]